MNEIAKCDHLIESTELYFPVVLVLESVDEIIRSFVIN